MSVIQKIRDKYAKVAVVAIALALLGFILMDALVGRSRMGGRSSTTVGRINGERLDITDFEKKVKQQEDYMQQQGYSQPGEASRQQAIDAVWNQEISRILMTEETDKLGVQVGKKEINDYLFGANPPEDLKRQFTDEKTGQYNAAEALRQINEMRRKGTPAQKESFNTYIIQLEHNRKVDKYNSMLSNSINYPRWFIEKENTDNSLLGKISLVREVYSSIPDSTIKISDKEIEEHINKHKDDFKQEESRSIAYVTFSASPSAADSADARNKVLALKDQFDSTKDVRQLLASEGVNTYYAGHISGKAIQIAVKDSIFRMPVGSVYGPYLDGGSYVLAKLEGVKQIPDSVKVRHILIATAQRDTASAHKLIDSIQTAIRNGSNFDSVAAKLSEDPGSKDKGGVYESIYSGQMVPEFNDFIFVNPSGTKGIVKTDFGYHYIEVLSQKGSSAAYKIAYLPRQIVASNETDNNASNQANLFAGDSRDQKSFDANYEKTLKPMGILKNVAADITPNAVEIQGLGTSRAFIKNVYNAKRGEVLQPERIGENYVVALVTEVNEEGTQTIAKARISVEPLLRNKKKAEQFKQKIGKVTTLEAAATALGKTIETVDSLRMNGQGSSNIVASEPRVRGTAFNSANKGKVIPEVIEGVSGVYVMRVDNVTTTPLGDANVAEQRKSRALQGRQNATYNTPINGLRKAASIKDYRKDRY